MTSFKNTEHVASLEHGDLRKHTEGAGRSAHRALSVIWQQYWLAREVSAVWKWANVMPIYK